MMRPRRRPPTTPRESARTADVEAHATLGTFRSFSVRNFRLYVLGQLVSQVGSWMRMVALSLLILDLRGSGVAVGLMTACQFVPMLVFGPISGIVADRSDKRRLLVGIQLAAMTQSLGLALVASMHHPSEVALYALAFGAGTAYAFDYPARRSLVTEMVPPELVPNAVALNNAVITGARVVGPTLAGALVLSVGYRWCFLVDGTSYLAVIVGLLLMRSGELHQAAAIAVRAKGQLRAGLAYVREVPEIRITLIMTAVVAVMAANYVVVLPLFTSRSLGGDVSTFTFVYSIISVGSVVGALHSARRTTAEVQRVLESCAAFGVALIVLAGSPSLPFAFVFGFVLGAASTSFLTTSTSLVQMRSDPLMRGRVLALHGMVGMGSAPFGGPILGVVCDTYGPRAGLVLGGLTCLGAAAWGRVAHRRLEPAKPIALTVDVDVV